MNLNWIELISGLVGGGTAQYLISSKLMPKTEKVAADAQFIDKLMERIDILEARLDSQTLVIKELLTENVSMKKELEYLRGGIAKEEDK